MTAFECDRQSTSKRENNNALEDICSHGEIKNIANSNFLSFRNIRTMLWYRMYRSKELRHGARECFNLKKKMSSIRFKCQKNVSISISNIAAKILSSDDDF